MIDTIKDTIDKVSTPTMRTGSTIYRVHKLYESNISPKVIALQMTENSSNKKYTEKDIYSYIKVFEDCQTKVAITAQQTKALLEDSREQESEPITIAV